MVYIGMTVLGNKVLGNKVLGNMERGRVVLGKMVDGILVIGMVVLGKMVLGIMVIGMTVFGLMVLGIMVIGMVVLGKKVFGRKVKIINVIFTAGVIALTSGISNKTRKTEKNRPYHYQRYGLLVYISDFHAVHGNSGLFRMSRIVHTKSLDKLSIKLLFTNRTSFISRCVHIQINHAK